MVPEPDFRLPSIFIIPCNFSRLFAILSILILKGSIHKWRFFCQKQRVLEIMGSPLPLSASSAISGAEYRSSSFPKPTISSAVFLRNPLSATRSSAKGYVFPQAPYALKLMLLYSREGSSVPPCRGYRDGAPRGPSRQTP